LGLGGSRYSPQVLGWLVQLGADLPFERAAWWLRALTGIAVSEATVRRQTEAAGATAVAEGVAEVERLEREAPLPPVRPERLVMGADGALVPLVNGEWAEMKLVSVGVPEAGRPDGARATQLSYFARLADAETFGRQALGELHRRGVEAAGAVAAVQDGAPWLQGFVDLHRPDAVRILDWPHAAEHLSAVAEQLFGADPPRSHRVAERLRRWLWEEGPARLLAVLAGWERARPQLGPAVAYFRERQTQLAYPTFRQHGWPVGSGATESGHGTVMQARMKRPGMRWARHHVNPLLALRLLECNGRWEAEGPALLSAHRQRQRARRLARYPVPCLPSPPAAVATTAPLPRAAPPSPFRHPWRRYGAPLSAKL
jgi:hypothetical protein